MEARGYCLSRRRPVPVSSRVEVACCPRGSGCTQYPHEEPSSANLLNVTMATLDALKQLRSAEQIAEMRGKRVHEVAPVWERRSERGGEHA